MKTNLTGEKTGKEVTKMSKRFKVLAATLAIVGIAVLAFSSLAFADDPADTDANAPCGYAGWGHRGPGAASGADTVSELTGLTAEAIQQQRLDGQSLVEIAAAQGVDEATLTAAVTGAKSQWLQEQVTAGVITQEQADLMLARMTEQTSQMLNRTTTGPAADRGFGPGGMMGRWNGDQNGYGPGGCWDGDENGDENSYGPGGMMGRWNGNGDTAPRSGYGMGMMGRGW
ncbi:MAG: hypothetical protein V1780_04765 [Chloroflexota bacterium]